MRRLKGRPEASDLFGKRGRAWLAELELPIEERETLDSGLRQIGFLDAEVALVERAIAHDALNWPDARRLMTVPGVNLIVAVTFLATVGDIHRFPDRRKLVAYLGLDPKVRQSGDAPASHGHISKQGSSAARHALVEASWSAVRTPGPLHAFYSRIRARRGHQVAITAPARKLACLFWVLLCHQEDYAFAQPSLTATTLRRLEITAGAPRWQDRRGVWIAHRLLRDAELDVARQAEQADAQTVRDRQAAGAIKAGASATPRRASRRPSKGSCSSCGNRATSVAPGRAPSK
jgi:transposase